MSERWLTFLGLQKSEASPAGEARERGEIYNRTQCVVEPSLFSFLVFSPSASTVLLSSMPLYVQRERNSDNSPVYITFL